MSATSAPTVSFAGHLDSGAVSATKTQTRPQRGASGAHETVLSVQAVYHRPSSDGGRTWGDPTYLSEGQPDGYTGIPGVVADGAGRVYAVWKVVDRASSMAEQELASVALVCGMAAAWAQASRVLLKVVPLFSPT